MDVAPMPIEAQARSAPRLPARPAAAVLPEGEEVARESFRIVFFNMPILRLAKFLVGATIITIILNPPLSLMSFHKEAPRENEVMAAAIVEAPLAERSSAQRWGRSWVRQQEVSVPLASSIIIDHKAETQALVEVETEEAPTVVIPRSEKNLVRSMKKRAVVAVVEAPLIEELSLSEEEDGKSVIQEELQQPEGAVDSEEPSQMTRQPEVVAEQPSRMARQPEVTEEPSRMVRQPEITVNSKFSQLLPKAEHFAALALIWMEWGTHIIIAAVVLFGFMVQLRRRGDDLLQSLSNIFVVKIPFAGSELDRQ